VKIESLFSNVRGDQLEPKGKKETLNKSVEDLEDDRLDRRMRFLTEMADMNQKDDLTKKLLKRVDRPQ